MHKESKANIIAYMGHIFEHFESSIFNFTGIFIAAYFFSQGNDSTLSRYGIFITISAYFWLAPIGATIFSWIGDKFGRRRALIAAYVLSIVPAVAIPFIPSYAQIGVLSSIAIILCRFSQGLGSGGAFTGRIVFLRESTTTTNLNMGILLSTGFLGALLGTLLSSLFMNPDNPWGWKVPYILGALFGIMTLLLRHFILETTVWIEAEKSDEKIPFLGCIKKYPRNVLIVLLWGMALLMPFYLINSWLSGIMPDAFDITPNVVLLIISIVMFLGGCSFIFFAWLSNRVDLIKMLKFSCYATFVLCVFYAIAVTTMNLHAIIICQILSGLHVGFAGIPVFIISQSLFPTKYRYSGFSVPFTLGQALMTGSTPFYAEFIFTQTGSYLMTTSIIVLGLILMSYSYILLTKSKKNLGAPLGQ